MAVKKRILCISDDESLLTSRKLLLEQEGYMVLPAFGVTEATQICRTDPRFDLIVMGNSIPQSDKRKLVEMLRPRCKAPVLSIRKPHELPIPEAQFSVDSMDGPGALIEVVRTALADKPNSASS